MTSRKPVRKDKKQLLATQQQLARQDDGAALLGQYIVTALYASMLEQFGGKRNMQRSFFAQAKRVALDGVKIYPPEHFAGEKVGDVNGPEYFTDRRSKSKFAGIFPAGFLSNDRALSEQMEEKMMPPETSAVLFVQRADPVDLHFPMALHEDADRHRAEYRAEDEKLTKALEKARTREEHEHAAIRRAVHRQFNWAKTTFNHRFHPTKEVQEALDAVGLKPDDMVQFIQRNRSGVTTVAVGGVASHGYVIDLADPALRERIAAKTAELAARISELESNQSQQIEGDHTAKEAKRRISGGEKERE